MAKSAEVQLILKVDDRSSSQMNAISASAKKMTTGFTNAGNSMKAFGAKSRQIGGSLTRSLTLPIVAIGGAMVKTFADFDATMTNIEARTGATATQMEKIRKTAIRMGRDTAFSANQAGDAMLELMASGSSVEEAISTLPHVLDLASAGQLELGRSADIVTDILAQFRLGVEDSEGVVNALAAAAQSSSADIESLAQGFGNVGPIAADFGISFEQNAAIMAVFSENAIKGAQGGTALKSILTAMTSGTKQSSDAWNRLGTSMFDALGNVKDFDVVIDEINKGLESMTQQERLATIQDLGGSFGKVGLSALLASGGIDTMLGKMENSQTASQVAKKQMESFNGAVNQLSGSLQTMAIVVIGPFVENTLQPMIEWVTKALNAFTDWAAENERLATLIVSVVAAIALIGPALWIIGAASSVFGTMLAGFGAVSTGVGFLLGILAPLATLLTAVVVPALGMAATAFASFWVAVTGPVGLAALALTGFILAVAKFNPAIGGMIDQLGVILRKALDDVANIMGDIVEFILKTIEQAGQAFFQLGAIFVMSIAQGIYSGVKSAIQAISDVGNAIIGGVKGLFGISSPSTVMMGVGHNLGSSLVGGFGEGVSRGMAQVAPQVNKMFGGFNRMGAGGGGLFGGFSFTGGGGGRGGRFDETLSRRLPGIKDILSRFGVDINDSTVRAAQTITGTSNVNRQTLGALGTTEDSDLISALLGMGSGGGARSIPSFAGGGGLQPSFAGGGDINITIKELNVPAGTPREAVDFIWEEIGKRLKRKGITGGGVTTP